MPSYPIVSKADQALERTEELALPTFYMGDFSVIGLRVSDCHQAAAVLTNEGFTLEREKRILTVNVAKATGINVVVQLLNQSGVACEMGDIADGMYQG